MRVSFSRGLLLLAVFSFAEASDAAAPTPGAEPAYVVRGRQTETRQRALKQRLERFSQLLSDALRIGAPDLLARLEPPPPKIFGYQILPRIVPDSPPPAPAKPQVVSFSWPWSDKQIEGEMAALDRLDADLAKISPPAIADRAAYEALVADYRKAVDRSRPIDSDVDYNWHWQKQIAADRPLFDRINARLDGAVAQQKTAAAGASPTGEKAAPVTGFDVADLLRIEQVADHEWLFKVTVVTDIVDADVVRAFKAAVEDNWRLRAGNDEYRMQLTINARTPEQWYCEPADRTQPRLAGCAPPARGDHIDLDKHMAHFPKDTAVLTTGAASLQLIAGRMLVLSPHDVSPRTLAHEFGHILGFHDAYFRGYKDLGAAGFQVLELVADTADIMANPGAGSVQARHFEGLIIAKDARTNMVAGIAALYDRNDPVEAVARFRKVLDRNPFHYGATLQLAKALDAAGKSDEALAWWKKILELATDVHDAETTATARARLAGDGTTGNTVK